MESFIAEGLLRWILFIPILTFHEWAHAWTAWKCGDDTARDQGRVSLNPIVHMEVIGTVVLPLLGIFLSMANSALAGFIIGWGKPVPVNLNNLSKPRLHDSIIAMAGPAINLVLAAVIMGVLRFLPESGADMPRDIAFQLIMINLWLCFFNLLPIPPLDGSHLLLHLTRMSYEAYFQFAQWGFIIIIVILNYVPAVRNFLAKIVQGTAELLARFWFAIG